MGSQADTASLRRLVAEFERLDARILNEMNIDTGDFAILERAIEAKRRIKRWLARQKALTAPPDLTLKLKKIRDNVGYVSDRVISVLSLVTKSRLSQDAEEEVDIVEALYSEGTVEYVGEGFFRRRNEAATVIVGQSLPETFVDHLERLIECYSLGLFEATIIYCRAVIEAGCFEALRRRGRVRADQKSPDWREYRLSALMRSVKELRLVDKRSSREADRVIKWADRILHSKRKETAVAEREAYDAIKGTYAIVEELFR
jgi:hypothetical protein